MIIAIALKTESGDDYLFHNEVDNEQEMLDKILKSMGDELRQVWTHEVSVLGDHGPCLMAQMLQEKIEELQERREEDEFDV